MKKGVDKRFAKCYNNSIKEERKYKKLSTKKIDRRKAYFVVLDTETCNSLEEPMAYDIGFAVVDKYGKVYERRSYVVYEVYVGMRDVMQSAYYFNKLPQYEVELAEGSRVMKSILSIKKELARLCKEYRVKAIMAHNARFDYRSTTKSIRYTTKCEFKYFLPYGVEIWDTLSMARDTICKGTLYRQWCEENGYMTKDNKPQATAEVLYRYITGNKAFVESHTGLEDVLIEKEIFKKCMSYHKPMRKKLFKD